jgi:hypothetical protein
MDDATKLELLWKHFKNVTITSDTKEAHNESILRKDPVFQQNIWTDSDRIPAPAPTASTLDGSEIWAGIIVPYKESTAFNMFADPTSDHAWHSVVDTGIGYSESNRVKNWVPPSLDITYTIKVWAGNPIEVSPEAYQLYPFVSGYEWEFDYVSGTLYFINDVPPIALQNGIWIEGWAYTGEIGREGNTDGASNTSKIRTLTFTSGVVPAGNSVDFVLETGGKCILVEATVTTQCTLQCFATSDRTDTNPYSFTSITSHMVDDGSYVSAGTRYYGERFVPLINMEDTTSTYTYWRMINNESSSRVMTAIIKVA